MEGRLEAKPQVWKCFVWFSRQIKDRGREWWISVRIAEIVGEMFMKAVSEQIM